MNVSESMPANTSAPKILLTGGLGYIGSHTAVALGQKGYRVLIIDNLANSSVTVLDRIQEMSNAEVSFVLGDLTDVDFLNRVFEEHDDIQSVIHFAAKKSVGESCEEPFLYFENNIQGTVNLLKTMDKYGVKNILFSSTAGVYDTVQNIPPYVESDEINPSSPYGTTKRVCERILKDLSQNQFFNSLILRYFNVVGAHDSGLLGEMPNGTPQNLLPLLFQAVIGERDGVKIFGKDYDTPDGTCIRDYIHVMDVAQAHVYALEYLNQYLEVQNNEDVMIEKGLFDVFNIGMGAGTTVFEMIDLVQKITGKEINTEIVDRRAGDPAISIANPGKASRILGRQAQKTIYDAVEDSWNFLKKVRGLDTQDHEHSEKSDT